MMYSDYPWFWDTRPVRSVFSSFSFYAKLYIEEIRATFVITGIRARLKQVVTICEVDVSASTFFFSYAIQVRGK